MTKFEFNNQLTKLEHRLFFFAMDLTEDEDKARDLLQETYLRALIYCEKFDDTTNLKAWTHTIMKNTFINEYHRRVRQRALFEDMDNVVLQNQNRDPYLQTDSDLRKKEILNIIECLDDEIKGPIEMSIQGFKYREIAEILDMKLGTVKSRIFCARKKLEGMLGDYLENHN